MNVETCTKKNPSLCLIPFSSLHISPDGSYRLCSSNIHKMFSLEDNLSLEQVWKDSKYTSLREAMLENQKPKMCQSACYSQEAKGLYSKRLKYNSAKDHFYQAGEIENDTVSPMLRYIDIAFSNVCNLKCVMCTSHYSSSWISHDRLAEQEGIAFRKATKSIQRIRPELLDEVLALSPQLYGVWIKGGEPFVDEQCLSYLQRLSQKKDRHPNLHLFIQSNGTKWNDETRDAISGLSTEIGISIDGVESTYQWIRGFSFTDLDKNIRGFASAESVRKLMFNFTLSAYNIYNIVETVDYFYKVQKDCPKLKTFYFSGIVRQEWGNVHAIPLAERRRVAEALREHSKEWGEEIVGLEAVLSVLEHIEPRESYFFETGKRWMEFCDRMRKQTLASIEPRLGHIFTAQPETQYTLD